MPLRRVPSAAVGRWERLIARCSTEAQIHATSTAAVQAAANALLELSTVVQEHPALLRDNGSNRVALSSILLSSSLTKQHLAPSAPVQALGSTLTALSRLSRVAASCVPLHAGARLRTLLDSSINLSAVADAAWTAHHLCTASGSCAGAWSPAVLWDAIAGRQHGTLLMDSLFAQLNRSRQEVHVDCTEACLQLLVTLLISKKEAVRFVVTCVADAVRWLRLLMALHDMLQADRKLARLVLRCSTLLAENVWVVDDISRGGDAALLLLDEATKCLEVCTRDREALPCLQEAVQAAAALRPLACCRGPQQSAVPGSWPATSPGQFSAACKFLAAAVAFVQHTCSMADRSDQDQLLMAASLVLECLAMLSMPIGPQPNCWLTAGQHIGWLELLAALPWVHQQHSSMDRRCYWPLIHQTLAHGSMPAGGSAVEVAALPQWLRDHALHPAMLLLQHLPRQDLKVLHLHAEAGAALSALLSEAKCKGVAGSFTPPRVLLVLLLCLSALGTSEVARSRHAEVAGGAIQLAAAWAQQQVPPCAHHDFQTWLQRCMYQGVLGSWLLVAQGTWLSKYSWPRPCFHQVQEWLQEDADRADLLLKSPVSQCGSVATIMAATSRTVSRKLQATGSAQHLPIVLSLRESVPQPVLSAAVSLFLGASCQCSRTYLPALQRLVKALQPSNKTLLSLLQHSAIPVAPLSCSFALQLPGPLQWLPGSAGAKQLCAAQRTEALPESGSKQQGIVLLQLPCNRDRLLAALAGASKGVAGLSAPAQLPMLLGLCGQGALAVQQANVVAGTPAVQDVMTQQVDISRAGVCGCWSAGSVSVGNDAEGGNMAFMGSGGAVGNRHRRSSGVRSCGCSYALGGCPSPAQLTVSTEAAESIDYGNGSTDTLSDASDCTAQGVLLLPVHVALLAASSDYWAAALSSRWHSTAQRSMLSGQQVVEVEGLAGEAMWVLLHLLYTGALPYCWHAYTGSHACSTTWRRSCAHCGRGCMYCGGTLACLQVLSMCDPWLMTQSVATALGEHVEAMLPLLPLQCLSVLLLRAWHEHSTALATAVLEQLAQEYVWLSQCGVLTGWPEECVAALQAQHAARIRDSAVA